MHPQSTPIQLPLFVFDKRCRKCGAIKPLEDFHRYRASPDGHQYWCKVCTLAHRKAYYAEHADESRAAALAYAAEHREERRAYSAAYRAEHHETVLAQNRAYDAANPEKRRQSRQRSRKAHRDERLAYGKAYREANRTLLRDKDRAYKQRTKSAQTERMRRYRTKHYERQSAYERAYRQAHLAEYRAHARVGGNKRRAHRLQAAGTFTRQDIAHLYAEQNGLCAYCTCPLGERYHVEHRQPLSRGGTNWPENLCCSCPTCNHRKHQKTEEEFRALMASDA
jgi:hypothetical protein